MKLISLSIENFGKLHHYDLTLDGGLNTVCEENGWGKSTLAAFLKAMFYGLPKSSKRSLDENDYRRFTPWQGGFFGGNLVFSCKKGTFRVERSFGDQESFALYDLNTGTLSTAFSESLGVELFGIDAKGFEQSVFFFHHAPSPKEGNDSIRAKLTGIDEIHDMSGFEKAFELLDDRAKDYKKRGGAGYIGDTETKIRAIKDRLAGARAKLQEQASVEQELDGVRRRVREATERAEKKRADDLRAKQIAEIRAFRERSDDLIRQKAALEAQFEGEVPTREELTACRKLLDRMATERAELAALGLTREEEERFTELSRRFPTGAPEAETLREKLRFAAALREEQTRVRQEIGAAERDLFAAGRQSSEPPVPQEPEIDRLLARAGSTAKTGFPAPAKTALILSLALLSLGAAALLFGALQTILPILLAGIAALAAGVGALAFALVYRARIKRANAAASEKLLALQKRQIECEKKQAELHAFLAAYAISEPDAESGLFALSALAREWDALSKKRAAAGDAQAEKKAALADAFQKADRFLARYRAAEAEAAPTECLARMEELCAELASLRQRIADRKEELDRRLRDAGIADVSLLEQAPDPAASVLEKEPEETLAELSERASRLTALLGKLNAETESIPEWEEGLARLDGEHKEQKERYRLLTLTRDLLARAHEDLTTRYLAPTRAHFAKYLALLCGKKAPNATLAADFTVTVLDSGISRQMESYSRGWRDLLEFCVRLALIDALYAEGETPFLLLDDPFANLDEERLAAAKALLAELAASRQILYLVCNGGRA